MTLSRFIFICGVAATCAAGARAQTSGTPMPASQVMFTPPAQSAIDLQTRGALVVYARDYGASGSTATSTGSMSAGSAALALSIAQDFANGEGVLIPSAGATFKAAAPTLGTPTGAGSTGGFVHRLLRLRQH